jgi:N-methylhydantoinase B
VALDPIALKVFWDRLIAATEEAAVTLVRTSFSTIVRENNDYACVLLDAAGRSLAQSAYSIPAFIGTMPITVQHFLDRFPRDTLRPGDVLATNDPWMGTGHLPDLTMATPVFNARGRLVAFAGVIAHLPDIGGTINTGGTREVYEEGLQLPPVRLFRDGEPNAELFETIAANVRVADHVRGDIMAMAAANAHAAARLLDLLDDVGLDGLEDVSNEICTRSEEAMRAAILTAPAGRYCGAIDFDGFEAPIHLELTVEIRDGCVHVDFTGSSQQNPFALNSVMNYTYAFTAYPLKCLLHPRLPNNQGCFTPFTVSAPQGSVVHAQPPCAVYKRNIVGHMISGALFAALAEPFPDRVMADSGSAPMNIHNWSGADRGGQRFVQLVAMNGGSGASPAGDGEVCSFPSNVSNTPVEMMEVAAPLVVECKELVPNSGGAGRARGGLAQRVTIRNAGNTAVMHSFLTSRRNFPAGGLLGGAPGRTERVYLNGQTHPQPQGRWLVHPGESFTIEYAGGGGLGPPSERPRKQVIADVQDELVTRDSATREYGLMEFEE